MFIRYRVPPDSPAYAQRAMIQVHPRASSSTPLTLTPSRSLLLPLHVPSCRANIVSAEGPQRAKTVGARALRRLLSQND